MKHESTLLFCSTKPSESRQKVSFKHALHVIPQHVRGSVTTPHHPLFRIGPAIKWAGTIQLQPTRCPRVSPWQRKCLGISSHPSSPSRSTGIGSLGCAFGNGLDLPEAPESIYNGYLMRLNAPSTLRPASLQISWRLSSLSDDISPSSTTLCAKMNDLWRCSRVLVRPFRGRH